ncbi:glycosyltransferase [Candidatus Pelagibacter sp.]|nr:glycosyltransferase [Candidatus Pelagibacter sp.]
MLKKKICAIIGIRSTKDSTFEISDNNEISNYYDKVNLFYLRNNSSKNKPKYNSKIKIYDLKFNFFLLIKLIFFSKKFFQTSKLVLLSSDKILEKIKQLVLLPKAILISDKINENPPELVHLFWGHYPSLVLLNLKKNLTSKISIFLGAYDFRKKLEITRQASLKANFIFTHSKKRVAQIKKFLGNNSKIICNYRGLNLNEFKNISFYKKKYTFCAVSFLEKHKNVEAIIDNFFYIKKKFPDSKLFIIGKGSKESSLKKMVSNLKLEKSVKFMGWLSKRKLYTLLGKTQFLLHFSKIDIIPNCIKEAMYSKCFVLSSKTFAIEEIINHSKNGFLVNPKNINKNIKIIEFCIKNKSAKSIIKNARIKIIKDFNIKKNIKFFYKCVSEL